MDRKFGIALVALIGIGIFALPSTIALFSGQHSFYNIDATGNQVPCVKCHGDVRAELNSNDLSGSTPGSSPGPHKNFQCEYCHRAEVGFSSGDDAYAELHYNGTAGELVLATTIENFETSNFPKMIDYTSGDSLDNVLDPIASPLEAMGKDGGQFNDQVVFREECPTSDTVCTAGTDVYAGAIDTGIPTGLYNYSYSTEIATTGIVDKAFDAREVIVAGVVTDSSATGRREVTPGTRYHAASLVSCMECHGGEQSKGVAGYEINGSMPYNHASWVLENPTGCGNCHYGSPTTPNQGELWLSAGGFGLTNVRNDTGVVEAHKEFVTTTSVNGILRSGPGQDGGYGAANIACVACHTHVAVDINFQKKYKVEFTAIAPDGITQDWSVGGFKANGTVNISIYGNQSGGTWATSNKSFTWQPGTDLYINGSGSKINGLSNEKNDTRAALESSP